MTDLRFRLIALWLILLVALGYINFNIYGKENVIADGQTVLLELRPVDPRSLMQGDYMELDYELGNQLRDKIYPEFESVHNPDVPDQGVVVITLDGKNVASFARFYIPDSDDTLATNEVLLRYAQSGWRRFSFGADNYFFQEGTGELFEEATYGELRVDDAGNGILVGLLDEKFNPIVAP